jgi:subfamily B ATP-binding cassette protein MsbA
MQQGFMHLGLSPALAAIAKRYMWSIPIVAVLGFVANGLEGFGISLLIPILGDLFSDADTKLPGHLAALSGLGATLSPEHRLYAIAAILFFAAALKAVVMTASATIIAWVDGKAGHEIRSALSRKLVRVGYGFHLAQNPARLVTIVGTEAWRASDAIRTIFAMTAAAGAVAVFGLILLFIEWRLSLAVFAGVLVIRFAQGRLVHRLKTMSDRVSNANRRLSARMLLSVDAARLIRIFGQEEREEVRFREASDEVRRAMFRVDAASAPLGPAVDVMHAALFVLILLGAYHAGVALPVLVTSLVLLYRMQPHLRALNQGRLNLAALRGPVGEVEWLLDRDDTPVSRGKLTKPDFTHPIVFDHIDFSYPNRPEAGPALSGISFSILPRRAIALLGRSGAGKTTIVNLLCRLIEPTAGRITVAGTDLRQIEPRAWLDDIGLAGQDIELIDGTIAENIAYGRPDASMDEIMEAARLADADGFIRLLPDGYATMVGTRGLSLSGGQRQRIGIGRALLRKPKLLILDEAMSAVDAISETAVVSLLRTIHETTTVLVISHRASTLACCQDGVVVEGGRIVDAGILSELPAYRRMAADGSLTNNWYR